MQKVTEQQIQAMAPNPAAASNGKKISQKGGFVRLECSGDDTFYLGECTGSGKSNYITTVDFIEPDAPVCRCSCPSRQFPCKHGLALLYEIAAGKAFGACEIPEDILKKRAKKQAKKDGADSDGEAQAGGGSAFADGAGNALTGEEAAKKKAAAARSAKAARTKKLKKQLEGLAMTSKLVRELLKAGLGTMGGAALKTYEQLSKQLGDYYLPGPQRLLNGLILEIAAFQKDGREEHYENAVSVLEKLWTLVKKSEQYLNDKLEKDEDAQDDTELYEELGGIWKLSELEALGKTLTNAELMQLSFWCSYDEARKEYIDTGCWVDLADGRLYMTYNYRPVKALKYVKQDDTAFGVAQIACAACYPGQGNLRIRWNNAQFREADAADLQKIRGMAAHSLAAEAKNAKNILKNALADPLLIGLLSYRELLQLKNTAGADGNAVYILKNEAGETIVLGDAPGMEASAERLSLLPDSRLLSNQVMLGAFYYDAADRRLKLQPLSIITETGVIRLLY